MWVTEMFEFNISAFADRLTKIPGQSIVPEQPTHSEYLQKNVFDELLQGHPVELTKLDFGAFTLQDVTPEVYRTQLAWNQGKWAQCFNKFVKDTPVAVQRESSFF